MNGVEKNKVNYVTTDELREELFALMEICYYGEKEYVGDDGIKITLQNGETFIISIKAV